VDSYNGYRPKFISLRPDSTAESGTAMGEDVDSDQEQRFAALEERAKMAKMFRAQRTQASPQSHL